MLGLTEQRSWRARFQKPDRRIAEYASLIPDTKPKPFDRKGVQSYTYDSLPSSRQIRLLSLAPGGGTDDLSFDLIVHSVDDCPPFEALSYTWGSAHRTNTSICNGRYLEIGSNLYDALDALRHKSSSRLIWADGICINQNDLVERASQVLLMREIYAGATSVVVWLGNEAVLSKDAFQLITQLSDLWKVLHDGGGATTTVLAQDLALLDLPSATDLRWKALDAIYWRAWFTRAWVIQEITLSKAAVVHCGMQSVEWSDMVQAALYISQRAFSPVVGVNPERILRLGNLMNLYEQDRKLTLHGLLVESRMCHATDPRDHLYSLLGLAVDNIKENIKVDYSAPAADVFTSVGILILKNEKTLDLFSAITDSAWHLTPKLPWWIPDWAVLPRSSALLSLQHASGGFQATKTSQSSLRFLTDHRLQCLGCHFDTIKNPALQLISIRPGGRSVAVRTAGEERAAQVAHWISAFRLLTWKSLMMSLDRYPTGENVTTAFAQTINAEQRLYLPSGRYAAPTDFEELYAGFHRYWSANYETWSFESIQDEADDVDRAAISAYYQNVMRASVLRRFCITTKGYMGLFPASTRTGDHIILLAGGRTPYVVRRCGRGKWKLVGECYVRGIMHGEAWDGENDLTEFTFV